MAIYDVVTECVQQQLEWKGSLVSIGLGPRWNVLLAEARIIQFISADVDRSRLHDVKEYPGKPANLAFDSSGTLLAAGALSVAVWSFQDLDYEEPNQERLELHNRPISSLAFAPKGMRLASESSKDGSGAIWLLQKDGDGELLGATSLDAPISRLAWRPDGRAIAATNAVGKPT